MKILRYLKDIYFTKNALWRHLRLFAYIGIAVLCLNNLFSAYSGYLLISPIANVQMSKSMLYANFGLFLFILMKLCGYEFKVINSIFNNNEVELPEFDIQSYEIFFKMVPILLLWHFYFIAALLVCIYAIGRFNTGIYEFVPLGLLFCALPFFNLIYIIFAKDFYFERKFLNPFFIVRIISKFWKDVIIFILKFTIFGVILFALMYFAGISLNMTVQIKLFEICFVGYVLYMMKLIFNAGMAQICRKLFTSCKNP